MHQANCCTHHSTRFKQAQRNVKHLDINCVTSQLKVFLGLSHTLETLLRIAWIQLVWLRRVSLAEIEIKDHLTALDTAHWLPAHRPSLLPPLPAGSNLCFSCVLLCTLRALLLPPCSPSLAHCPLPSPAAGTKEWKAAMPPAYTEHHRRAAGRTTGRRECELATGNPVPPRSRGHLPHPRGSHY